eukprot:TRINITY_DN8737_c0_g1_i5.p1 TRINITY_DN8737_c0_g1~~TRINITY_DN8737_c0_g1_i5.p1  ORF type:complete len:171 (+),score=51.78 TRINITY_DN8737_c0_g1_i5:109-621(+)
MIRRPPRSTLSSSSAASDVYKRQVESVLALNASTRMAGLHHYTKDFMARLGAWIQLRNMCSFARLVIAIAVELCRLYELGIEVQRAEARMAVNPELYNESVEQLRAKRFTSILKLVQDGASFMKLCSAFSGLRLFLLPKVSEKEAAFFGVVRPTSLLCAERRVSAFSFPR